jgi:hypothetical protein
MKVRKDQHNSWREDLKCRPYIRAVFGFKGIESFSVKFSLWPARTSLARSMQNFFEKNNLLCRECPSMKSMDTVQHVTDESTF